MEKFFEKLDRIESKMEELKVTLDSPGYIADVKPKPKSALKVIRGGRYMETAKTHHQGNV